MKEYKPTIGLEVHAELKTKTKMFCASLNAPHSEEPNIHVCPICMGHPGTLPVVNETAVKYVLMVGKALGGRLATYTEFDRKNYFYPDIPKGYQISQYLYPLVSGGTLDGITITRVHLEEDTARSLHDQGDGSIMDFNRAGVPLMELVTEPVIHTAKDAGNFARELQLLLRTLGVSDANMERGEMRVEVNISVSDTEDFGTKVEVKNLNSFKSVESAIEYEIKRHIKTIEEGEKIIQETRGWDEAKGQTFSQRIKESAHDYRYFPDPDIPKFDIAKSDLLSRIEEDMPELPLEKRLKYKDIGLTREQIEIIISNKDLDNFFKESVGELTADTETPRLTANYLTTDLLPLLADYKELAVCSAKNFALLIQMVKNAEITSRVAKDILADVVLRAHNPKDIATERGLLQSHSSEMLQSIVDEILAHNQGIVLEYKNGKEASLQYLIGQGMKMSRGSANPKILAELIKESVFK